eukprot:TRINITY_DN5032_c1_g1_i1.p1 TRINITY_DN5032_c1_g1~~TRINITY_DN5032_c1_g1_i1.p1  ORF type:complete len:364 (+),score=75.33 TRINITY_DN5032_c1_g1_i1:48-1139(+)
MQLLDADRQLNADYCCHRPLSRSCCPAPFQRARPAKRRRKADTAEEKVEEASNLFPRLAAGEELPAEQADLLKRLSEAVGGFAEQWLQHKGCSTSCVALQPGVAQLKEGRGRSDTEERRSGLVLPRGSFWIQGDIFAEPRALMNADLVPPGGFVAAIIDPPWESKSRGVHYKTCQLDQLLQIPLLEVLAENAVVAVWVTNDPKKQTFVKEQLFPAWGLQPATEWTWLKVTNHGEPVMPFGPGRPRLPFEKALVGVRTNSLADSDSKKDAAPDEWCRQVFASVPGRHSQKPFLDDFLPKAGPKLEVFARNLRPGWTSWGNEVLYFQDEAFFGLASSGCQSFESTDKTEVEAGSDVPQAKKARRE